LARQAGRRLAPAKRVRMDSAARQAQIVLVTVRLVGQYGIEGTTVSRIAAEVGLSEMALYRHFDNKVDMLVGAFEYLIGRTAEWHSCSSHPWVPTRLREIGQAHLSMLTADVEMFNSPMMQFWISRPAQAWVSPVFVDSQLKEDATTSLGQARQRLYRHIEEGKAQGSVRPCVDPVAFAWLWLSWAQGEDLHYLIAERTASFNRRPHLRLLDLIIADIELPERQ
jgi:AcrR family transcriptional regulator